MPTTPLINSNFKKLSIIIPVYNEARTLRTLLDRVYNQPLPQHLIKEMLIVESNSTDGSKELVQAFEKEKSATADSVQVRALYQKNPRGKGNAVREALKAAKGDIILIQDGDLEYDVADYPQLLEPILDGRSRFVLGSRHLASGNWKIRSFEKSKRLSFLLNLGGVFFHAFFNLVYGTRLTDPTTMYKVFCRSCVDGIEFSSDRFDFDYEILGKLIRLGFTPLEVPISYSSRGFEEGKKIRIFRDPVTWIRAILRFRFEKITRS